MCYLKCLIDQRCRMICSRIIIFSICLCLALASSYNSSNGTTTLVTCDNDLTQVYQRIGEKFYFLGKRMVSWFKAAHLCRRYFGDLALIESASEMEAISTYLKIDHGKKDRFWISGNDIVDTFTFVSIRNGLPLKYTDWSAGEPDNRGTEHCMHLWLRQGASRMNIWICTERAHYLCQRQNYTRCYDGY